MGILFIASGILVSLFSFAFSEGEFRNPVLKWLNIASGGAMFWAVYHGDTNFGSYAFFMVVPILSVLYCSRIVNK